MGRKYETAVGYGVHSTSSIHWDVIPSDSDFIGRVITSTGEVFRSVPMMNYYAARRQAKRMKQLLLTAEPVSSVVN